ncbi:MAG: class I SAM-dependent methyltransferase [Myxococcaceae bacterium]|nr:MAG: class I SAM-dependent methyltransferase [Myxococcaceae bacterium]
MTHDHSAHAPVQGFGADRAPHYDAQAAVNLAGYQAAYELGVSALTAMLDGQETASLLHVGLGTGAELVPYLRFNVPGWRFTGVEPSAPMLEVARKRLEAEGLLARMHLHEGELRTLPPGPPFDGAQLMGVLHHVEGEEARVELLREVARRLKPGAPLVLGCRIGKDPELTNVEFRRLRAYGVAPEKLEARRQAMVKMRPIESDAALFAMFERAGFVTPKALFVSLQYKVFLARFAP